MGRGWVDGLVGGWVVGLVCVWVDGFVGGWVVFAGLGEFVGWFVWLAGVHACMG